MSNKKIRKRKLRKPVRNLLFDRRGISDALTTIIITAGVIAFGIAVLYWAYSWGNIANQQYSTTVGNSQDAIGENLAFEYVYYSNNNLTVYLINCGMTNNVSITRLYIWINYSQPIGTFTPSALMYITNNTAIPNNSLSIGNEGYFTVPINNPPLVSGSYYRIRVVTGRGRNFDGEFSTP
jgi:hypothetical protein